MGEGTTRVANTNGSAAHVRELGDETEATRQELDELVMELDRRRHQAFDWRLQVRRHARALALLGVGVVVVVGIGVAVSIPRKRRRQTLADRLSALADWGDRLGLALGRIAEDPDRLAKKEPAAGPMARCRRIARPRNRACAAAVPGPGAERDETLWRSRSVTQEDPCTSDRSPAAHGSRSAWGSSHAQTNVVAFGPRMETVYESPLLAWHGRRPCRDRSRSANSRLPRRDREDCSDRHLRPPV